MGILEIILVIFIIMAVLGGGWGYQRRADWGPGPGGGFGLLFVILLIILLFRVI